VVLKALVEKEGVSVPNIYARFPLGRIEEWLESKELHVSELPAQMHKIAQMLAHFHTCEISGLSKESTIIASIEKWLKKILKRNMFVESFIDFESEYVFLKEMLTQIRSPIVFSHGDLQENNILCDRGTGELHFIDFEYSSYNYRGFDFGNHFCEWSIEYSDKLPNGFLINVENYPSAEQRLVFFTSYLNEFHLDPVNFQKEIDSLEREAELFTLFSHFYWGLWGVIQSKKSSINFNYHLYAFERFQGYLLHKRMFFEPKLRSS